MSLPFIVRDGLEKINLTSIYILRNVISNEKMQDIKKIIDKCANNIEEHSNTFKTNVSSTFLHFYEFEHYNPKISQEIKRTFEYIQNKIEIHICTSKNSIEYDCMQLRKINGPTLLHTDGALYLPETNKCRLYSVIVALNSDYEGGEVNFPEQDVTVKLEAGDALIFPPYWTHPHSTNELNGTFRYTINSWITGSEPTLVIRCKTSGV